MAKPRITAGTARRVMMFIPLTNHRSSSLYSLAAERLSTEAAFSGDDLTPQRGPRLAGFQLPTTIAGEKQSERSNASSLSVVGG